MKTKIRPGQRLRHGDVVRDIDSNATYVVLNLTKDNAWATALVCVSADEGSTAKVFNTYSDLNGFNYNEHRFEFVAHRCDLDISITLKRKKS
jgi:hypothetical protein